MSGDNFVNIDKESCIECLDTMYDVVEKVNEKRTQFGLPVKDFKRVSVSSDMGTMELF